MMVAIIITGIVVYLLLGVGVIRVMRRLSDDPSFHESSVAGILVLIWPVVGALSIFSWLIMSLGKLTQPRRKDP